MEKENTEEKSSIEKSNPIEQEFVESTDRNVQIINSDLANKKNKYLFRITSRIRKTNPSILGFISGVALLAIANISIFTINSSFSKNNNQLDSVSIAGVNLSGMTPEFAKNQLVTMSENQLISINVEGKVVESSAEALGVKRDVEESIKQAVNVNRPILERLKIRDKKQIDIALKTSIDKDKLNAILTEKLGSDIIAKNAALTEQNGAFIVTPGSNGVDVNTSYLAEKITSISLSETNVSIDAKTNPIKPTIQTEAAESAKNSAISLISDEYKIGNEAIGYKIIQQAQKSKWIAITPNEEKGTIEISLDKTRAVSDLESIGRSFNRQAKERVTVTIPSGGEMVLDPGLDGLSIAENEIVNAKNIFAAALEANEPASITIASNTIPRSIKNMNGEEKMVLVDIDRFTTYAYENGRILKSVTVSTGKRGHETPRGKFAVLFKIKESSMRGCSFDGCWDVPNVKWQTYFTNQGHAIHGAYWYINWGRQNVSHGCVNMVENDARWFYDWTEKGTPVIVV